MSSSSLNEEDIVISGCAGKFPLADEMNTFRDNLFNKVDMVTTGQHFTLSHQPELPPRIGKLNHIEKFDAGFFGVGKKEADVMEPMYRGLMEKVVEAICDAGVNPKELEGTQTGVFVTTVHSDCQGQMLRHDLPKECHALTGLARGVLASRISYSLKLNGPAYAVDTACSASLFALNEAYEAMRAGKIETAIVGASVLNLDPMTTVHTARLGTLGPDGICKVFDDSANGYVRSEAICAIILQKSKNARRIYSKIIHCKVNCDGYKKESITFPSAEGQHALLADFYSECHINPTTIDYLEAHGTGTAAGDFEEIRPIDEIFCKNRPTPLLVGSVKSNMGHAEAAAALCQVAKAIITMETGYIPPNLHLKTVRRGVEAFQMGRVRVVTETTPFPDVSGLIAISSFGFGGANGHVLLERHIKRKVDGKGVEDEAPRLVCASGRIENGLEAIFEKIQPLDCEFIALLHHLFQYDIPQHDYRGFTIASRNNEIYKSVIKRNNKSKPDFCLCLGTPNAILAKQSAELLALPLGREIFKKVEKILINNGFNKEEPYNDELAIIILSVTVQITIVEALKTINLTPKIIEGSSFGRFIKTFAEGSISLEETISKIYHVANIHYNNKMSHDIDINEKSDTGVTIKILTEAETIHFPEQKDSNLLISLLKAIGRLYELGYNPHLHKLYPKVKFPVSRGTAMISPLIRWNHNENWFVPPFGDIARTVGPCEKLVKIDLNEPNWSFITDYVIDGRNLFPASAYLYMVWKVFADMKERFVEDLEVVFEDIRFERATLIPKEGEVEFLVKILKGSGCFQIIESDACVAIGRVGLKQGLRNEQFEEVWEGDGGEEIVAKENDVYKELRLRGYDYDGLFKSVKQCDLAFRKAEVKWHKNWIAFMENMFQLQILNVSSRDLFVPTFIQKLTIDSCFHLEFSNQQKDSLLPVYYYKQSNTIKSGGIEIRGLNASAISRKKPLRDPVLEKYVFVPNEAVLTLKESLRINVQLILENTSTVKFKFAEIAEEKGADLTPLILAAIDDQPTVQAETVTVQKDTTANASDCLLVIGSDLLKHQDQLEEAFKAITLDGFVLSREDLGSSINCPTAEVVTVHQTPKATLVLLRKTPLVKPIKLVLLENSDWLQQLKQLMKTEEEILVCSQNGRINGILGLMNCIWKEPNGQHCRCLFIQDTNTPIVDLNLEFYQKQLQKGLAMNVFQNGQWGTYRHLLLEPEPVLQKQRAFVEIAAKGDFSSLKWVEGSALEDDGGCVNVAYSALNFKDVLIASGRLQCNTASGFDERDFIQGLEYAGKHSGGRRVMGVLLGGALSTQVKPDEDLCLPIPDEWSLEDAATVPIAYLTALYALVKEANIKKGQTILIHAGAGGVGQAAINIAFHYGLEVFTTVGSPRKRRFLLRQFPNLKAHHIGNSRDVTFEQIVLKQTKGRGVDVILNSLTQNKLQASLKCLARGGKFLELGKYENRYLQLELFKREASFFGISLDETFRGGSQCKQQLMGLLKEAIKTGVVKPLHRRVFHVGGMEEAYRLMAGGGHIGKVLIKIEETTLPSIEQRFYCDAMACYVVTGGLGGFGLELIDWLIKRGAKKIVTASQNGLENGYQATRIRAWKERGVELKICCCNIATKEGCEDLIKKANALGVVKSIFHLAASVSDGLIANQTEESFAKPFGAKAEATSHLDLLTTSLCPHLEDFVVFSSFASGRGNPGQANYAAANSTMERICEERKRLGLPALAIQWGPIGDVGLVAETQIEDILTKRIGTVQQKIANCLLVLDRLLKTQSVACVSSMMVAEKKGGGAGGRGNNVVDAVAKILGVRDLKMVSLQASLPELGMDSMMVAEVRQTVEKECETALTVNDVMGLTFERLYEMMAAKGAN